MRVTPSTISSLYKQQEKVQTGWGHLYKQQEKKLPNNKKNKENPLYKQGGEDCTKNTRNDSHQTL